MRQEHYETIQICIQHGAPALAPQLIQSLNVLAEKANKYNEILLREKAEAKKLEVAKAEEAAKVVKSAGSPIKSFNKK
jgi:hypothetical protein